MGTLALTPVEQAKLENYEEIVKDGLQTCFDVGRALLGIRDEQLWNVESQAQRP